MKNAQNSQTPSHRWRDTILAVLAALVVGLAALVGFAAQVLTAVMLIAVAIGIGSRIHGAVVGDLETGMLREPLAPHLRWHRRQLLVRLLALAAWIAALWPTMQILAVLDEDSMSGVVWFTAALGVAWVILALIPRRRVIGVATNVAWLATALLVSVGWVMALSPPTDSVELDFPLGSEVSVVHAGPSPLLNHHWLVKKQRHAMDVVIPGEGWGLGTTMRAPARGTVVTVADGREDDGSAGDEPAGNHVVIDMGGERFVMVAHLQKDSVTVKVGDTVARGQAIAKLGNSGNSSMPHLHIQVQSKPTWKEDGNVTFPITFRNATPSQHIRRGHVLRPHNSSSGDALNANAVLMSPTCE
jgi:hypothetical protein